MTRTGFASIVLAALVVAAAGCSTGPRTYTDKMELHSVSLGTIAHFKQQDPTIRVLFEKAYGYAVFPSISKTKTNDGAAGRGAVYDRGKFVGVCDLAQGDVSQPFSTRQDAQVIFFQTKEALDQFRSGHMTFPMQATGILASAGAAEDVTYTNGFIVFLLPSTGPMGDTAVGGQQFTYVPDSLR